MKQIAFFRLIAILIVSQCFIVSAYADATFTAVLNGAQEAVPNGSAAVGAGSVVLNAAETQITVTLNFSGLSAGFPQIEKGARGTPGQLEIGLPGGNFSQTFSVSPAQVADLKAGLWYFNVRSGAFPKGEIRGQIEPLCAPSPAGMTAWYRAEGSANDSIGARHGTPQNGASFANGKAGQAFKLDGFNDYVSVADTPFFRHTNLTVEGWFNFSGTSGETLIAKTIGTGNGVSFSLHFDGTFLRARIGNSVTLGENVSFPFTPVVGDWYHIAYTFDDASDSQFLYVNGAAVAAQPVTISIGYDEHPTTIGAAYIFESPNNFFKGKIDEVHIYNRALSAAEIQPIYNVQGAGVCDGGAFTNIYGNGKIAFASNRTGINQIFTMNPDGSNQTNVTNSQSNSNFEPAFSPDGSKIAFSRIIDNNYEIYVMNADGGNQFRLTNNPASDAQPDWSPDGSKIVFPSDRTGGGDIYVMDANGTNQIRLTTNPALDFTPKFSPDGTRIVFASRRDGNDEIYLMNADGSNQTRLTNNSITDGFPAFSPDGRRIVFYSTRTGNLEIFGMNADGSNPVNLSNNPAADSTPVWSPDGTKIAFEINRDGNYEIYLMNSDGSNQKRLTDNGAFDSSAAWQPVGAATVSPTTSINLNFPNATKAGYTVATPLLSGQVPLLPPGYLLRAEFAYDIRTSAQHAGSINVQFAVRNVLDAQSCSALRLLHFVDGDWDESNNLTPTFNAGVCTLLQTVNSLSPFVVAELAPAAQGRAVSGKVIYGITPVGQSAKNIPGVLMVFSGTMIDTETTNSSGAYLKNNLNSLDNYIVTPLKTGNANGITAFDATLVLRHVAANGQGANALNANQRIAADTNADGLVTAFDTTQILRYVSANGATADTGNIGKWKFNPVTRNYDATITSLSGEDYTGILIGEINGDWTP